MSLLCKWAKGRSNGPESYPLPGGSGFIVSVGQELALYHAAGLSRMEVIQTATKNAAQACGKAKELGTVEPGKLADIVIVKGDPLATLEALENVVFVVKGGEVAFRADWMSRQD